MKRLNYFENIKLSLIISISWNKKVKIYKRKKKKKTSKDQYFLNPEREYSNLQPQTPAYLKTLAL